MSSSAGGIGSTLTGGIQDIAAILPLLGTEQCSVQVGSALTRGYLYAASAPMSIFGSLGVVSAGFKTLVACFSFRNIEGAKILGNMGFEPQGENLSLIMVEPGKGKNAGRYVVETRMDELIKELNIDKNRITGVSHKSTSWNVKMMATTALLSAFSIAPYINLNRGANNLNKSTTWVFPVLRATGGFITATLIQLLIQRRITTLSDQYLADGDQQRNTDVEAAGDTKKYQMIARCIVPTWLLLYLLLIGLIASVVGYVGCFSVVQNSTSTIGPVSWLCLEVGLSVLRLAIWAWNPTRDDAPPLEIILELDKYNPLPTCNKDNEEILKSKVLPLTRARDFLKIITSFAGLIEPFSNPDLSLYYTLTRKRPSKKSAPVDRETEPENADKHKLGERTLYITVFDHKERTTRVYTRDDEIDTFYSTKSDAPLVDVGHFLLEVEIDAEINPKGDPVSSVTNNLNSLNKHHRSILEHIQYRLEDGDVTKRYAIENSWTMKVEDTISTVQRLREEDGDDWKTAVQKGKAEERNEESSPICDYLMHSSIERERQLLYEKRVKWIVRRMEMISKETKERFEGEMEVEYRVNQQAVEMKSQAATKSPEEIELLLCSEQYLMELLLLYEVKEWEELFWNKLKTFLDQIGNGRVEEKERLTREWRADCWKRLNSQMHVAEKRWADVVNGKDKEVLGKRWASSISELFEGDEKPNSISLSELRGEMELLDEEIRQRIENEIEDTEFRLKRGFDLGRFDQFWDDDTLFECRYSRSKWLYLKPHSAVPLEIYSHALKGNKNIMHITFGGSESVNWFQATILDLPWVFSISCDSYGVLDDRDRYNPLFIKSTNKDLIKFAEEIRFKLNPFQVSTYIFTDAEYLDMHTGNLKNNAHVLISFVAPTSGQRLILRLKHSGKDDAPLEVTLGSTILLLNPSSKSSLTIDDITLYPIPGPSESDRLSFEPGIRNYIIIQFRKTIEKHGHRLHDIELLDEAGLEEYGDIWKTVVENGKEEESLLACNYSMLLSVERERRFLDENRVQWIARRMEMITQETKERFQGEFGVEYRVNKQAVEKMPATKSREEIEVLLHSEQYLMELLLLYEVKEWEELFWNKFKAFLDRIGNDRVEDKERLTREWMANCWRRLNPQMHAAVKRLADLQVVRVTGEDKYYFLEILGKRWASSISQLVEGVENPNSISLSELRREMEPVHDEIRLRMENEIEDTEFRLKLGSDSGQFDQFWNDDSLFKCRYSRSKWLYLEPRSTIPYEIYSHALKRNKNIIHITFSGYDVYWLKAILTDLPWVTSISVDWYCVLDIPDRRDPLFIKTIDRGDLDLNKFAKEIRLELDPFSTYIFTDAIVRDMYLRPVHRLGNNARVLVSFVAPKSGRCLILRLKHFGEEQPLKVTLGSTITRLNPSSKSSLTIDDITLYPIPGPSEPDHLSFEPGIRNDIVIEGSFLLSVSRWISTHKHFLHDIALLDEAGLEYMPRSDSDSLSIVSI